MHQLPVSKKLQYSLFIIAVISLMLEGASRLYLSALEERFLDRNRIKRTRVDLPRKTEDSFRIQFYGESTVYGEPTPEVGFVEQLKFIMDRLGTGKNIETYNYSRPGEASAYLSEVFSHTMDNKPDLAVVLVGHNEFLSPALRTKAILVKLTEHSAFIRIMERYLSYLTVALIRKWKAEPPRQDISVAQFEKTVERYRENIRKVIESARSHGVPLILCTAPYNRFWPPEYIRGETGGGFDQELVLIFERIQNHEFGKAKDQLLALLHENPDNPTLLYLLGRVYYSQGAYAQAAVAFSTAKERDPFRIRVPNAINAFLREVSNTDGVYLLDLDDSLGRQSPHGILGYELLADNVHPTPKGNYLIAQDIITAIREKGIPGIVIPANRAETTLDNFLAYTHFLERDSA